MRVEPAQPASSALFSCDAVFPECVIVSDLKAAFITVSYANEK